MAESDFSIAPNEQLTIASSGASFQNRRFSGAFSAPSSDRHNALIEVGTCYPPAIDVGDLIRVDFEQSQFKGDGIYIVTDRNEWIGIRRFDRTGDGWRIYDDCDGLPRHLTAEVLADLRVIGLVKAVYKQISSS